MTKTLVLKARGQERGGPVQWHDCFVLQNAIGSIAENKSFSKAAMWLTVAGKIELAREEAGLVPPNNISADVTIELRNIEAKVLWREMKKLGVNKFGRNQAGQPLAPPLGLLGLFLADVATQLGYTMPKPEDDEDDEDDEDELEGG